MSGFFEPSIQSTVDSIREYFTEILSLNSVSRSGIFVFVYLRIHAQHAFLVGGFASSPWLSGQLNRRLSDLGLKFFKPDTNT